MRDNFISTQESNIYNLFKKRREKEKERAKRGERGRGEKVGKREKEKRKKKREKSLNDLSSFFISPWVSLKFKV